MAICMEVNWQGIASGGGGEGEAALGLVRAGRGTLPIPFMITVALRLCCLFPPADNLPTPLHWLVCQ